MTQTGFQIHTYWIHSMSDVASRYPRNKDKSRRNLSAQNQQEPGNIQAKTEKDQESTEDTTLPVKSDCVSNTDTSTDLIIKNPKDNLAVKGSYESNVTESVKEPQVKIEMTHEYVETSISPIKSEEDTSDNDCDDVISEDEDETIDQIDSVLTIKTEQFQYLCPISTCTFTTVTEAVKSLHLKSSHGILKDLTFLKMVL